MGSLSEESDTVYRAQASASPTGPTVTDQGGCARNQDLIAGFNGCDVMGVGGRLSI